MTHGPCKYVGTGTHQDHSMIPLLQELHCHSTSDINVTNEIALAIGCKCMKLINNILRMKKKKSLKL